MEDLKNKYIEELKFCLKLWKEQGYCEFGGYTKCNECASPYLMLKLINGEVLHGKEVKRLSLSDWENKLRSIEMQK